jgi:hypothetical protein
LVFFNRKWIVISHDYLHIIAHHVIATIG